MSRLTPAEIAAKQVQRSTAASQDYVKGIQSVTSSPMEAAAAQQDKMRQNVLASIDDGSWAAGLRAVSLQQWQAAATSKGQRNYAQGVKDAQSDILAFHQEFQPHVQQVQAQVKAMPSMSLEDNLARMVANARGMAQFKRSGRRR